MEPGGTLARRATVDRRASWARLALPTPTSSGKSLCDDPQSTEHPFNRRDLAVGTAITASAAPLLVFLEANHGTHYSTSLGTLVSKSWLVTAAHCRDTAGLQLAVGHIGYEQIQAFARPPARPDERRHITSYIRPDYAPILKGSTDWTWEQEGADIALVTFPRPVPKLTRRAGSPANGNQGPHDPAGPDCTYARQDRKPVRCARRLAHRIQPERLDDHRAHRPGITVRRTGRQRRADARASWQRMGPHRR